MLAILKLLQTLWHKAVEARMRRVERELMLHRIPRLPRD